MGEFENRLEAVRKEIAETENLVAQLQSRKAEMLADGEALGDLDKRIDDEQRRLQNWRLLAEALVKRVAKAEEESKTARIRELETQMDELQQKALRYLTRIRDAREKVQEAVAAIEELEAVYGGYRRELVQLKGAEQGIPLNLPSPPMSMGEYGIQDFLKMRFTALGE